MEICGDFMTNSVISVIIPIFNSGLYLKECLDSVSNQTFKDLEIICINDGSTDNSLNILHEYNKLDNRIIIIDQENSGPGVARNAGLNIAKGNYIYFMDSDDFLELNALEELYSVAEEKKLDILLFKLISLDDKTHEKFKNPYYEMDFLNKNFKNKIFNYQDLDEKVFSIPASPPGKLYKKELISDIRFPEGIIFEDNPFFIEAILKADKVYFYDEYLYNRRIRDDSITTSNFENFSDCIPMLNMIVDIVKKLNLFDLFASKLYSYKISTILMRYGMLNDDELKLDFFNKMKTDFVSHKQEYESDIQFENVDFKLKQIFYLCISSNTRELFDLQLDILNYKNELSLLKNDNEELNDEILELKNDNTELNNEILELNKLLVNLQKEIRMLTLQNDKLKLKNQYLINKNFQNSNKNRKNIILTKLKKFV